MELIIKTDLQTFPAVIEYNHEDLKMELSEQLKKYQNIVVTEDGMKEFKADKANLNRLKTALEDKRKEIKKQCLQPYENFEKNIKELVALIDEPIQLIDRQLKEIDGKKKEQKISDMKKIYHENIGRFEELVPFEKIYNVKWLNSTYKLEAIALEIHKIQSDLESGLQIIDGLATDFKQEIKDKFFETLDISKALAENARLKELREKQKAIEIQKEKQVRQFLTEKTEQKQNQEIKAEQTETEQKQQKTGQNVIQKQKQEINGLQRLDLSVWVTPHQMWLLREFLSQNNITFKPVRKVE